jgi:hypothetical protein
LHGVADVVDGPARVAALDGDPVAIIVLFEDAQQLGEVGRPAAQFNVRSAEPARTADGVVGEDVHDVPAELLGKSSRLSAREDDVGRAQVDAGEPFGQLFEQVLQIERLGVWSSVDRSDSPANGRSPSVMSMTRPASRDETCMAWIVASRRRSRS